LKKLEKWKIIPSFESTLTNWLTISDLKIQFQGTAGAPGSEKGGGKSVEEY